MRSTWAGMAFVAILLLILVGLRACKKVQTVPIPTRQSSPATVRSDSMPSSGGIDTELTAHAERIVPERSGRLRGIVQDSEGRPVEGLRLLAYASKHHPPGGLSGTGWTWLSESRRLAGGAHQVATGTTGKGGTFQFEGLGPGNFGIITDAKEMSWFIRPDATYPWGQEDIVLVAVPAVTVLLKVTDIDSGEAVPSLEAACGFHAYENLVGMAFNGFGANGILRVTLPLPTGILDAPAQLRVRLEAICFESFKGVFDLNPDERPITREIRMRRIPSGTLILEISEFSGRPFAGLPVIDLADPETGLVVHPEVKSVMFSPGHYRCSVPAGRWTCRVKPGQADYEISALTDGFVRLAGFSGEVEIPPGGEAQLPGRFQPCGSLRLDLEAGIPATPAVVVDMSTLEIPGLEWFVARIPVEREGRSILHIPPGAWSLRWKVDGLGRERLIQIQDGQEARCLID